MAEAKAHCDAVLAGVEAVTEQETPIREGACGSPALVKLVSIGRSPAVQLSPPAVVSCDMVASLHKWFKADVQRLARAHLGGSIVKIEVMSSYSCRNAYGRSRTNLSEHGRANALDIGGFVTASTDTTRVLTSWGTTAREIKYLASKAEAERVAAALAAGKSQGQGSQAGAQVAGGRPDGDGATNGGRNGVITGSTNLPSVRSSGGAQSPATSTYSHAGHGVFTNTPSLPGVIVRVPQDIDGLTGFGFTMPSRLGGAKPGDAPAGGKADANGSGASGSGPRSDGQRTDIETRRTMFLHEAHAAACKYFGTVLGPEANKDHSNHFHVDMAQRKTANFCQ